jgi:lipopolysaccharide transport system permease protein
MQKGKYYKEISSQSKVVNFNFSEVWQYRDLILLFVKRNFISKYKQTILGPAWAVIQPLLTTVVFTFIFGNVAKLADCGAVPTFLFYMCGNISWHYFSGCLTGTSDTFIAHSGTMGKVYFPRLCMPIATVLSNLISFGIQFAMFIVFLLIYLFIPGYSIGTNLFALLMPIHLLQMAMLGLGLGIIISACTTKYRDLRFLVGFGVSLWMYITPVAYSKGLFKGSVLFHIVRFNPMTPVIEMIRCGFLGPDAGSVDWIAYGCSWVVTIVLLMLGVLLFNKVERTFMDTI